MSLNLSYIGEMEIIYLVKEFLLLQSDVIFTER